MKNRLIDSGSRHRFKQPDSFPSFLQQQVYFEDDEVEKQSNKKSIFHDNEFEDVFDDSTDIDQYSVPTASDLESKIRSEDNEMSIKTFRPRLNFRPVNQDQGIAQRVLAASKNINEIPKGTFALRDLQEIDNNKKSDQQVPNNHDVLLQGLLQRRRARNRDKKKDAEMGSTIADEELIQHFPKSSFDEEEDN
jgi:hypothetical protein